MAISIVDRPIGRRINYSSFQSAVVSSSGGALFTKATHGITTGNIIYIKSNVSKYNGFWYAEVLTVNTFQLRAYSGATIETFTIAASTCAFYTTTAHDWNSVHLPITYRIKSTSWPLNTVDTARTTSTIANYYNFTRITLPGTYRATSLVVGDKIEASGGSNWDGIYTIIYVTSNTDFVIDLVYDAAYTNTPTRYHYANYCVKVKVFAGIRSGHTITDAKYAISEVTEVSFIPDENGLVYFNIAEHVKERINVNANDLTGEYAPNNVNAWCDFYIETAESYDLSTGSAITTFTDTFSGEIGQTRAAVNSCLPFKNVYGGWLSEYIPNSDTQAKWLTNFDEPKIFAGKYFDVSHINTAADTMRVTRFKNGVQQSQTDTVTSSDVGIYRFEISVVSDEDTITLVKLTGGSPLSQTLTINVDQNCSDFDYYMTWLNQLGGFDYFNFTARKKFNVDVLKTEEFAINTFTNWPKSYGEFASKVESVSRRESKNSTLVNSQFLSEQELDGCKYLLSSILVEKVEDIYNKRVILVDKANYPIKRNAQDLFTMSFNVTDTNMIEVQKL